MTGIQENYGAMAPVAGVNACGSCGQQLPPNVAFCIHCGASQKAQVSLPPSTTPAPSYDSAPSYPTATPGYRYSPLPEPTEKKGLDDSFGDMTPAGTGRRLAAFTIDVLCVATLAAAVWFGTAVLLGTPSLIYTAIAAGELVLGLWAWQAIRGATIGNKLLRIRVTRADKPYAMGAGRATMRGVITLAGGIVAIVGAWLIVASSAWDSSGRKRGWQDKAAGTQTVSLAPRKKVVGGRTVISLPSDSHFTDFSQNAYASAGLGSYSEPLVSNTRISNSADGSAAGSSARGRSDGAEDGSAENSGASDSFGPMITGVQLDSTPIHIAGSDPSREQAIYRETAAANAGYDTGSEYGFDSDTNRLIPPVPGGLEIPAFVEPASVIRGEPVVEPAPVAQPAPASETIVSPQQVGEPEPARITHLLLTFDTGQQLYLANPGTGMIGRNPRQRYETDQIFSVEDPASTVSKAHLEFEANGDVFRIMDNHSTNGTGIMNEDGSTTPLSAGEMHDIPLSATVRIGDRAFNIFPIWEQ